MPKTELLKGIEGLLHRPGLEPEARKLIELAMEAQKTGRMPSIEALRAQTAWQDDQRLSQHTEHLPPLTLQ